MPVSRELAAGLGREISDLYLQLELDLASGLSRRLAKGLGEDDWTRRKLAELTEVRRWANALVSRATQRGGSASLRVINAAFERGSLQALEDLGRPRISGALPGQHAIERLAVALRGRLQNAHFPIVRSAVDAFQRTAASPVASVLGGAITRRQAAERVWNGLLDQGFTALTDKAGRRWSAAGYAEMTTRTATAQAAVQGHLDRLESLGVDLVVVSDAPQECRLCRPWEGRVLRRGGDEGAATIQAESELTGAPVTVHVAGSVAEAVRAGLMHPSCRHSLNAYLPGLTKPIHGTADPEGDAARQQLRYLERQARQWDTRRAGALTDASREAAAAKVTQWRGRIKDHLATNETLTPRPDRARAELGNVRRG